MWANPWPAAQMQQVLQGVPHGQVDWAALAKQWIQQKEAVITPEPISIPPPPPTGMPPQAPMAGLMMHIPPGPPPPPPPPGPSNGGEAGDDMDLDDGDNGNNHGNANFNNFGGGQTQGWEWGLQQNWNVPPPNWSMPQPPIEESKVDTQTYEYGHGESCTQSFDYNHGGDQYNYQQDMNDQGDYQQYWENEDDDSEVQSDRSYHGRRGHDRFSISQDDDSGIDAAKRKNLPAWIREGLEKMEREKHKKSEKERIQKELKEAKEAHDRDEKAAAVEILKERGGESDGEPSVPKKSRFDSDNEETEEKPRSRSRTKSPQPDIKPKKRSPSPEEVKTEEEKQLEMVMKTRKMLTEILLAVTTQEMEVVAKEVFYKEKNRAAKGSTRLKARVVFEAGGPPHSLVVVNHDRIIGA